MARKIFQKYIYKKREKKQIKLHHLQISNISSQGFKNGKSQVLGFLKSDGKKGVWGHASQGQDCLEQRSYQNPRFMTTSVLWGG